MPRPSGETPPKALSLRIGEELGVDFAEIHKRYGFGPKQLMMAALDEKLPKILKTGQLYESETREKHYK